MDPILTIKGLTKTFGAQAVLRGVDLDVLPGDVVSIIGASGSGKTTLLRCIDLLEEFEGGEIRLDDLPLGYRTNGTRRVRLSGRELARQRARIGMVFQSYNLFPHLTALHNVMLGLTKVRNHADERGAVTRRRLARSGRAGRPP